MKDYLKLVIGSHLFGTNTPTSDRDYLHLVIPSIEELVANHRVVVPTTITDGEDVRTMVLGEFVTSLGNNIENTLVALSYPEIFGELESMYLTSTLPLRCYTTARGMLRGARTPKQVAHAWRVMQAGFDFQNGNTPRYPLNERQVRGFLEIKELNEKKLESFKAVVESALDTWSADPQPIWYPVSPPQTSALAAWVAKVYTTELQLERGISA